MDQHLLHLLAAVVYDMPGHEVVVSQEALLRVESRFSVSMVADEDRSIRIRVHGPETAEGAGGG